MPSLVIAVGVGSPHHTGSSSVQLRILCAISAIKEVTSSQCADFKTNCIQSQDSSSAQGDAYLGVITRGDRNNSWYITVSINDKPVDFEIDTGAVVTVISSKHITRLEVQLSVLRVKPYVGRVIVSFL